MKFPIIPTNGSAILVAISLVTPAFAVINIDYASIGNAGNAADAATGSLYGAVAYAYQIARNETTISQYAGFLNAVAKTDTYSLYSAGMTTSFINGISRGGVSGSFTYSVASGSANKPITYVSWFDAAIHQLAAQRPAGRRAGCRHHGGRCLHLAWRHERHHREKRRSQGMDSQ